MHRFLILLVVLLLAALLYHCLAHRPEQIQADVFACVETRLAEEGFDDIGITVDGRDVLLVGTADDEEARKRIADVADTNCGARVVVNEITVVPPLAYRTQLCIDRDGLEAEGSIPDSSAASRYRAIAAERLGAVPIETGVTFRADPPSGYDRIMTIAFAELAQLDRGCIEIVDGEVRVTGDVRSSDARDRLVADMERAAGSDFTVTYDLAVPALSGSALVCQEALDRLLAPGEQVLFDFDSAELHAEGRALLDEAEQLWETCPGISLIVAGHTSSEGDAEYNRALSERRADAVVDYLVRRGFDRDKLTPIGYGEAQPQASNATEEGRALNRRMEFRVRETAE